MTPSVNINDLKSLTPELQANFVIELMMQLDDDICWEIIRQYENKWVRRCFS
jgi:hypothetical protein